jgi:hypothetical protein
MADTEVSVLPKEAVLKRGKDGDQRSDGPAPPLQIGDCGQIDIGCCSEVSLCHLAVSASTTKLKTEGGRRRHRKGYIH